VFWLRAIISFAAFKYTWYASMKVSFEVCQTPGV
jgi:hypothetical protein